MVIPLSNRLSYKQARLTVVVAFILGTLLSLVQVSIDYANEDASINREIHALQQISHNPAARIAYNIDSELAQELLLGLLQSPSVIRAEIIDSSGGTLASVSRPRIDSRYRVFSDFLFRDSRIFEDPLFVSHAPDEPLGVLRLEVDTYPYGATFLSRAALTMVSGFVRSLLLSILLLVLFYYTLTKPLVSLIHALSERDEKSSKRTPVACPSGHEKDEIGVLVKVTNHQLESVSKEVDQRREAENRLTEYLGELENIVSARTAELKAANNRLLQSNADLDQAREQALHTAQLRSAFLANMSHEIRTPLNGLLGMVALASDGPLNDEQREQLSVARESGKVLMDLLNDILDLSKFEAGELQFESIPFDLASLGEECATLLSQNAASGVELSCLISPQLPTQLLGDPTRVRQIINNLLSNALKFTRQGQVTLELRMNGRQVEIELCDTGIGIAEDAMQRIFQPFVQAAPGITRQYGGTGLGLALTRRLCEAMHGELLVQSTLHQGSRFCARLPLPVHTPAAALPQLQGSVFALCPSGSGLQRQLNLWLPALGLRYQHSASLPETLPDCDLLICNDPEQLAALREKTSTPLMLISSYGHFLSQSASSALAPLQQIAQPLTRQTLLSQLREHVMHQPRLQVVNEQQAPLQHADILLVEDNPVNQMVAKGMLLKLGCRVSLAENGEEALQQLAQQRPDLILMDCNMPIMDGYEATQRIRQDGRWADLPIIALTANALADERERCLQLGMNDYLAKPFRREDLVSTLQRWLPPTSGNQA